MDALVRTDRISTAAVKHPMPRSWQYQLHEKNRSKQSCTGIARVRYRKVAEIRSTLGERALTGVRTKHGNTRVVGL